jgi:hypothetical protein
VTHGRRKNQVVTDWLRHPNTGEDADAAKTLKKRFTGWLKRLQLVTPEQADAGNVSCDIESCIGNDVVLKMVSKEQRKKNPATNQWEGTGQHFTNVDFMGVHPLTHYEIPDELRAEMELPPAIVPPEEQAKRDRAAAKARGEKVPRGKAAATAHQATHAAGGVNGTATTGATVAAPPAARNYDDL